MSKVQLAGDASGTGIFTIASPNSNTDRTLTLPDNTGTIITTGSAGGVSQTMLAAGVAGNGPAFRACKTATAQALTSGVNTKVVLETEVFDTASRFNNTASSVGGIPAYAFLPNVAGYYQFNVTGYSTASSGLTYNFLQIFKNGLQDSAVIYPPYSATSQIGSLSALIYLNGTTDYVEFYVQVAGSGAIAINESSSYTYFNGFLARAA